MECFNKLDSEHFDKFSMIELISFIHNYYKHYLMFEIMDLKINPGQIPFILQLKNNENVSQDELAKNLSLSRGTAAKSLRKLDDEHLINREVDMENRRKYNVSLTYEGKKTASKIENIDEKWNDLIYKDLNPEEKEIAEKILKKLAFNSMEVLQDEKFQFKGHHFKKSPFLGLAFGRSGFGKKSMDKVHKFHKKG